MQHGERMMLSDAIETAIRAERKVITQRRMIAALSVLCGFLAVRLLLR